MMTTAGCFPKWHENPALLLLEPFYDRVTSKEQ